MLTDDQIIIEIARMDGFEQDLTAPRVWYRRIGDKVLKHFFPPVLCERELPPYLTSRDAIVPVIEKQSYIAKTQLVDFLCEELLEEYDGSDYTKQSDIPLLLCATPRQLCIALLKATGKWHD